MLATEKKQSSVSTLVKSSDVSTPLKLVNATGSKLETTVPLFRETFGDAIAQALEQAEKVDIEEKTGKNVIRLQNNFYA